MGMYLEFCLLSYDSSNLKFILENIFYLFEVVMDSGTSFDCKRVGCKFDFHMGNSLLSFPCSGWLKFKSVKSALNFDTQHKMSRKLDGKSGREWHNTRFSLPTLLYAGYGVKLFLMLMLITEHKKVGTVVPWAPY